MDSRTCQTSAASPAEPGGLPFGLGTLFPRMQPGCGKSQRTPFATRCEVTESIRKDHRRVPTGAPLVSPDGAGGFGERLPAGPVKTNMVRMPIS